MFFRERIISDYCDYYYYYYSFLCTNCCRKWTFLYKTCCSEYITGHEKLGKKLVGIYAEKYCQVDWINKTIRESPHGPLMSLSFSELLGAGFWDEMGHWGMNLGTRFSLWHFSLGQFFCNRFSATMSWGAFFHQTLHTVSSLNSSDHGLKFLMPWA